MKTRTKLLAVQHLARNRAPSPLGALVRGAVAGAAGAFVQTLFFKATAKLAPRPTALAKGEAKPELAAQRESSLETVARRTVDGLMQRGPLQDEQKTAAGNTVHYLFGAGWGALYGVARESLPALPASIFGFVVWAASDNLLLPLFRLSAWPNRYRLAEHHYALHAHVAYGLGTAATYSFLRDAGLAPLAALPAVLALRARSWARRTPPGRLWERTHAMPVRFFHQVADNAFAH